jgi:osmotically-inducible protein OsmY
MSEWNRSGRDDNQRRYGSSDEDGRQFGGQDRWWNRGRGEQRSFDQDDAYGRYESYGYGRYGGYGAGEGYRPSYGRQGYGGQGGASYGGDRSQSYGQRYGQGGYGAQNYGGQIYGERGYGPPSGYREYGGQQGAPFAARNDLVRQVSDGEGEHRGRGPRNYTRSDERIREDVNDRLTDDPRLDASEIDAKVEGGEVTLNGTVTSRDDKRRAEDIIEQVSGVKHVQNNLRVQSSSNPGGMGQTAQSGQAGQTTGQTGQNGRTSATRPS